MVRPFGFESGARRLTQKRYFLGGAEAGGWDIGSGASKSSFFPGDLTTSISSEQKAPWVSGQAPLARE
jgi:hypothetical protein